MIPEVHDIKWQRKSHVVSFMSRMRLDVYSYASRIRPKKKKQPGLVVLSCDQVKGCDPESTYYGNVGTGRSW